MRNCRVSCEDLALMHGFRDRGIPVDEYEFERIEAACAGLKIFEDGGPPAVFDLLPGRAGCELYVVISNESRRPLVPVHIGFEGPDWVSGMSLLPDPRKLYPARRGNTHRRVRDDSGYFADYSTARNAYVFPIHFRPPMIYPREEVLNQRIARSCVLYPGEHLEGWVLAMGQKPMPSEYRDGDRLKMRLTLFDQRDCFYRATFHPIVRRARQQEPPDSGEGAASGLRDAPRTSLGRKERSLEVGSRRLERTKILWARSSDGVAQWHG
jgi:hypothetical protein